LFKGKSKAESISNNIPALMNKSGNGGGNGPKIIKGLKIDPKNPPGGGSGTEIDPYKIVNENILGYFPAGKGY